MRFQRSLAALLLGLSLAAVMAVAAKMPPGT